MCIFKKLRHLLVEKNLTLILQSISQCLCAEPHGWACGADSAVLEEHGHQCNHGQTSIGNLGVQLGFLGLRIGDCDRIKVEDEILANAEEAIVLEVTWSAAGALAHEEAFVVSEEKADLGPALNRHLGNSSQAMGNVGELQAERGRKIAGPAEVLWHDVTNGGQHTNSTMLQFHCTSTLESISIAVGSKAQRIPKANWGLDTKLAFKNDKNNNDNNNKDNNHTDKNNNNDNNVNNNSDNI